MLHSGAPSGSGPTAARTAPEPPLPPPPTAPNTENDLLASLTQLSLQDAAANPLPPTPRSTTPSVSRNPSASRKNSVSSPHPPTSARKPKPAYFGAEQSTSTAGGPNSPVLRRQASASTLEARSTPPTLLRKASMNSLQRANVNAHSVNGGSHSPRASTSRRSSYTQDAGNMGRHGAMGRSPLRGMDEAMDERPPKPILTAEAVAHDYFTREMGMQHIQRNMNHDGAADEKKDVDTETVVILHDACYGHRFSRPKTSKANLLTIVERPERIHASILGVAAAYVKLGERGSDERYAIKPAQVNGDHDEDEKENKPPPRPFTIHKSSRRVGLGEQAVTSVHGVKWMEELKLLCEGAEAKLARNGKELIRPTMDRGKGAEEPQKFHEGDLYLCAESLDAMEGALGAVCDGVDAIFSEALTAKTKRAFVVVRPPGHHCSAGYPSGFCWVNNVHVGIQHAALNHGLTHAAIIDFDLHHGDGSQDIAWGLNERVKALPKSAPAWKKAAIGYFSIHDINSYPCEWGDMEKVKNASLCIDNAHGQNIWNVHLAPWKNEQEFWELYESKYTILLEKTRLFLKGQTERIIAAGEKGGKGVKPKAAIFLSAGFDASEHESDGMQRHKVNVPTEFYARLTRDIRRIAEEEGTSVEGRIASVLEGGYSDRALCSGVFSHISGLAGADPETYEKPVETTGLGAEVARRMGNLLETSSESEHILPPYDPSWWKIENLEALEAGEPPKSEPEQPKKPRENGPPATYYASTQSFDAKITETPKGRRSSSGLFAHPPPHGYKPQATSQQHLVRAPTPPPLDLSWAVAAKALCRVLIPADRQTMSCKPEDLNAAATRERKERQSLTLQGAKDLLVTPPESGPVSPEPTPSIRKSTRERKPARPVDIAAEEAARVAATNRAARRRTLAGAAVIATDTARPGLPASGSTARQVPTTARVSWSRRPSNADSVMSGTDPLAASLSRTQGNDGAAESAQQHSRTSSSVRSEFPASTRGGASGVAVRKTRPPAAPRASTAGVIARAPISRQASGAMAPVAGRRTAHAAALQVDGPEERRSEGRGVSAEMDSLSAGMKKVKITLTTKAQREAKAAAKATSEAKEISATAPHRPGTDGANSHKLEENSDKEVKTETTEHKMGMRTSAFSRPSETALQPRPDYSSTTSQLHASQQLSSFSSEKEQAQAASTANLDQAQHDQQTRDEAQDADQYERDQKSIVEQLQRAAKAAAEIAEERGAMSPPARPTTAGSGGSGMSGPGTSTSTANGAGEGVLSPSGIRDRIQRLAQVSNVALESAREMGSGRSSFIDVRSPPRAASGASGRFERVGGGAGPVGVKREELPVWSATGAIPFAPVRIEESGEAKKEEVKNGKTGGGDSIWEVPETPRK